MKLILLTVTVAFFTYGNGAVNRGRIVGGDDALIEDHPYQVSLRYNGEHSCGGSILKPNVIITAAHCVFGVAPKLLTIRAGTNNREKGGIIIAVKTVIPSEGWNDRTIDNDIAILILEENLKYTDKILPIELATEEPKHGETAVISGWGLLKEGELVPPVTLKTISLPIWERSDCQKSLESNKLTENMICAGVKEAGKSTCQRDSGGPLVVNGKLAGIVSWGIGCGRANSPSIFTNVPKYLNWISMKI